MRDSKMPNESKYYKYQDFAVYLKFIYIDVYENDRLKKIILNPIDIKSIETHYKGTTITTSDKQYRSPITLSRFCKLLPIEVIDDNTQESSD